MQVKIPVLDLKGLHSGIKGEIIQKISELYDNTEFVYGRTARIFEENFKRYNQTKYALAVDNGTNALEIALRAAGVGHGDEVITVANTFIATVAAIHFTGAKPVFVDIDPNTWNMDPGKIESKITLNTKAILPVHLYGQPAEMLRIREIALKNNLILIGDSAQSIGSQIKENGVWKSTSKFADISTFSFYPGKNMGACGEAGAVVTDKQEFAEFIAMFRDHGSKEKYIHEFVGRNNRIDAFQAAILDIKLKYIDDWNQKRRQVAEWYYELLSDVEEIQLPFVPPHIYHIYHLFVILVENRENFQKYLAEHGIGTALHYKIPVHLQKAFAYLGYKKGDLPITESIVARNVSLPMYPELQREEVEYVCQTIKDYFGRRNWIG